MPGIIWLALASLVMLAVNGLVAARASDLWWHVLPAALAGVVAVGLFARQRWAHALAILLVLVETYVGMRADSLPAMLGVFTLILLVLIPVLLCTRFYWLPEDVAATVEPQEATSESDPSASSAADGTA